MTINPSSGTLTSGQTVDLSFTVQEPTGQTVNTLVLNTPLGSPQWTYTIYVNGYANEPTQSTSSKLEISSFLLTYKSTDDVTVGVTLSGAVPTVSQSTNLNLVQAYEVDSNGNQLGTPYTQNAVVGNNGAITTTVATPIPSTIQPTSTVASTYTYAADGERYSRNFVNFIMANYHGNLTSGSSISFPFTLTFPSYYGSNTFTSTDYLQLQTDLNNPQWTVTLVVNGVSTPLPQQSGNIVQLSGSQFSYPPTTQVLLDVNLQGTAPAVASPTQINFVKVQPIGSDVPQPAPSSSDTEIIVPSPDVSSTSPTIQPTYVITTVPTTVSITTGQVTPTTYPTYAITTSPTIQITNTTPTESVNQLIAEQNAKIDAQNTLIAEQNAKMAQQNNLLDQIIGMFKSLLGIKS